MVSANTDAYRFKASSAIDNRGQANKRVRSVALSGQALVKVVGTYD